MACISESFVPDLAGLDVMRASRGSGDRCCARKCTQSCGCRETIGVIADLGEHAGGEDGPETRNRTQDRCLRVGVETMTEFGLEGIDGLVHRGDDAQQSRHGMTESGLHLRWLSQRRSVQVGKNLLGQARVVAAATAVKQSHQPRRVSFCPAPGVGTAVRIVSAARCLRFGNACRACG